MNTGQTDHQSSSSEYISISGEILPIHSNNKSFLPALNVSSIIATIDFDALNNTKIT